MKTNSRIYIAGHLGLIGSAILGRLQKEGYRNLIFRTRGECDLMRQDKVEALFMDERPEYVIMAAAKVGGIKANISYPAQFIYENLAIQNNIIQCSYLNKVKKLLFFGSACTYPRLSPQPIKEEYLLTGAVEPTNEPYAIAKISGIVMCQAYNRQYGTRFISAMVTNTYGPRDNFNQEYSHVIPSLLRKFHEAKVENEPVVNIWGSGKPCREFIYVEDVVDASIFLMENYSESEIINVCTGVDITIEKLANIIKDITGYNGKIIFDSSFPDGAPRKLLDASKINNLGWKAKVSLSAGIEQTYNWYKDNITNYKAEER